MSATKKLIVEYSINQFKELISRHIYNDKKIEVEFLIEEVGGDPLDRFPGRNEVTRVRASIDLPADE